ncbi:LacI family DNA-binding transcriptional regulator, partial [Octadecabacter sp.]|nr:LacI family DNA-binding transcriptional regulator [Octadecabacter sp.]
MNARPTILDVAKKAGVSKSTVSLVLQGNDAVKEATRLAVRKAMADIGYVCPRFGPRQLCRFAKAQTIDNGAFGRDDEVVRNQGTHLTNKKLHKAEHMGAGIPDNPRRGQFTIRAPHIGHQRIAKHIDVLAPLEHCNLANL